LETARTELCKSLNILVDKRTVQPDALRSLGLLVQKNQGRVGVYIRVFENGGKGKLYSLGDRVELNQSLISELGNLFSEDAITMNT
jgi:hypothetical protein